MATLQTNVPEFFSDICDEIRLFFPVKRIDAADGTTDSEFAMQVIFGEENGTRSCFVSLFLHGTKQAEDVLFRQDPDTDDALLNKKLKKRFIKNSVYSFLKSYTGISQPWGSLTGIRPTKLVREISLSESNPYAFLKQNFDVSDEKLTLLESLARTQAPYLETDDRTVDIYIDIPFCRSRCTYCSFVSKEYGKNMKLKDDYLSALYTEMKAFSDVTSIYNVRCVYIGGGTPTALDSSEFENLLEIVDTFFPDRSEYTVEAGRCDTLTDEKFMSMKNHGVTRISINPQTTNDRTLALIGRDYKNRLFAKVFARARKLGFDNINSDIIFGLPGEDKKMMKKTLTDVIGMGPENITVHTLAIKNSSAIEDGFMHSGNARQHTATDCVSGAVSDSVQMLTDAGYAPYYMYRQKYMSGNLENVGYAKGGRICRYNIDNMEETTNILAFGSGSISKRIFLSENRIERAANVKDIVNFCQRTDEMIRRKKELFGFY